MQDSTSKQDYHRQVGKRPTVEMSQLDGKVPFANSVVVQDQVEHLQLLTSRIEEFLAHQINRLQDLTTPGVNTQVSDSAELDQMIGEFEEVRRNWEAERLRESERMRCDAEQLQEAWLNLEQEQRELLTRQAAVRTTASTAGSVPVEPSMAGGGNYPTRSGATVRTAAISNQSRNKEVRAAPYHKAQIQFQKLRREMQKHAQQRDKR
ncbi:MAG: hypothetical protein GY768_22325 [Planctomycetaceae bacterium]|nr:hypothetical protein [Planctomycetaceae bacterium]